MECHKKPYIFAICFTLILSLATCGVLLDAFVIPQQGKAITEGVSSRETSSSTLSQQESSAAVITDTSYSDSSVSINISTQRTDNTNVYIADIVINDISHLKTALAYGQFGRNIKQKTSEIAQENNAIFAVNGDYYGFRNSGFVLRGGTLYRNSQRDLGKGVNEDLVVNSDGSFSIINENNSDAINITNSGAREIFSFGPGLVDGGKITVDSSDEVEQSMQSNPRTAIGMIEPLHYIIVVSDGRTDESAGLSLLQLAGIMKYKGCAVAYNLDGGGSSTMYFNGKIINKPTEGRSTIKERRVSDIVYIA